MVITMYTSGEVPSAGDLIALRDISIDAEVNARAVVIKVETRRTPSRWSNCGSILEYDHESFLQIKWCLQQGQNKRHGQPDGSYCPSRFRLVERFSARRLK